MKEIPWKILADKSCRSGIALLFLLEKLPSHRWEDKQGKLGRVLGISRPITNITIKQLRELGYIKVTKMQGTKVCSITLND